MSELLLSVDRLEVGFDVPLLSAFTFSLARGRSVLIYGPNGVGKSTILRTLFGLLPPLAGRVEWFGGSVPTIPRSLVQTGVRLLGQGNRGFGQLSLAAQSRVLADLYGLAPPPRGSGPDERRPVAALSFGQRRRGALTALQAGDPQCILMDEPLAGLDRAVAEDVAETCRAMAASGASLLLVEHRVAPLVDIVDELIVIQGRRVSYIGPIEDAPFAALGIKC